MKQTPPELTGTLEARQPEILVVHNHSNMFLTIAAMLQSRGFQVILAPNAQTALEELDRSDVSAVIAGVDRDEDQGLHVLGEVKERRAAIKTLIVTELLNPVLPLQAYEMDIDDYLHWPLTGSELSNRLRRLLGQRQEEPCASTSSRDCRQLQASLDHLLDGCTEVLLNVSRVVHTLQHKHRQDMPPELAQELESLAAVVQSLGGRLGQACLRPSTAPGHQPCRPCHCH